MNSTTQFYKKSQITTNLGIPDFIFIIGYLSLYNTVSIFIIQTMHIKPILLYCVLIITQIKPHKFYKLKNNVALGKTVHVIINLNIVTSD